MVDMRVVLKFLGLDLVTTEDKNLELIRNAVEAWIQTVYCRRNLVSTSYKEKYDGTGCNSLVLDNYPIISLNRLSMGSEEVMRVKNSSTFGHASVSVSSTGVTLYKDGTSSTILFTASATMSAMATAISAVSGWSATVSETSYNSYPSNLLSEKMGLQCVNNAEASLMMPADGEWDFEVDSDKGILYSSFGFGEGTRNIFVDYSAGYATIPDDLQLATLILIKNIYQKRNEESWGVNSYSISGISMSFDKDIPMEAKQILNHYRRTLI
jgi:hypothetical protein